MKKFIKPLLIIIKKELKAYFDHPIAYIILVVFLAINGFFYFRSAYLYNIADMRSMFNVFIWMFMFIIPAVTMRLIAEEKQNHTLELLLVQPIKEWQIVVGKFFGSLIFIIIALMLTLLIPLMLSSYGDFDCGMIAAQYIGAVMLGMVSVSIGIFASSVTKNQIVSFMVSVVTIFVFVCIGLNVVLVSMPSLVKIIFEQLSITWHYFNVIRGVLDARDIIYFLTATASFLAASYWLMIREHINQKRSTWRRLRIGILALISIAVIINLLGLNIHGRLDLTKQKLYTLSDATENIVGNLDDVLTIDFYSSKELPPEVSLRARDVSDLLNDYQTVSNGKLKVNVHEVDTDNSSEAEADGIQPVQFNTVSSDEFQVKKGYFGLVISYLDEKEVMPFIETSDDFEYQVTKLIRKMTVDKKMTVGFLSGHEEKGIYSDLSVFEKNLAEQYEVITVTIDSETGQMDAVPDILVVAGPKAEMSDGDKEVLRTFINNNGKVFFMIDTVSIDMQTLQVSANENSLTDLVEEFGVRINNNIVGDLRSHESISLGGGAFNYIVPYPFWPRITGEENNPISGKINMVPIPWVSSLTAVDDKKEVVSLLTTTDAGFEQTENFDLLPDQDFSTISPNSLSKKIVGMSVVNKQEEEQSSNDIRLVVVGDSDFLTDAYVNSNPSAILFALNSVDWLAQDEQLISVRSKQRQMSSLVFEKEGQKNTVKYINLIGLPVLVAAFGFAYLYKRKKITNRQYSKY